MFASIWKIVIVMVAASTLVSSYPQFSHDIGSGTSYSRKVTRQCVNGVCTERVCINGVCSEGSGGNVKLVQQDMNEDEHFLHVSPYPSRVGLSNQLFHHRTNTINCVNGFCTMS